MRVLIVEDNPDDAELMVRQLRRSGFAPDWRRVDTEQDFLANLDEAFDVILSDYELPQFNGLYALKLVQERGLDIPFILISGTIGEEVAVMAIKQGATDYLLKDRLGRLGSAISHALEQRQLRRERRRMEAHLAAMSEMGARLSATRTAREAAQVIVEIADKLFGWDACTLDLYSREKNELIHVLNKDLIGGQRVEVPPPAGLPKVSALAREIIQHGAKLILKEPQAGLAGASPFGDVSHPSASILYVPIRCGTVVTGLLAIHSYTADAYSPDDLRALQALADHCGGALERIRAGEALRESEERYRALVETTFDWIWEVDAEGRYTYASPKVRDLLGYAPEDVVGRTPFELMPEAEARRVAAAFAEIVAGRQPFAALENTNLHKEGRLVVLETSGVPVFGPGGEYRGYRGMDRDITERKQAEAVLREEAVRRRILIEQSRDGIVVLDENGAVCEANRRYSAMLGYLPEEVLQLHVWDWDTQWNREQLLDMIRLVDEAGAHFETRHRRKDGTIYDVEMSTNGAVVAGRKLVFCVCRDITHRKRAEAALRMSEERHRLLFEISYDAIMLLAPAAFRFVRANPATLRSFGVNTEGEFCKLTPADLAPENQPDGRSSAEEFRARIQTALQQGAHSFEWTHRRLSGEEFPALVSLARMELGGQTLLMVTARDITAHKQVERELSQRLELQNQLAQVAATVPGAVYSFRLRPDGTMSLPYTSPAFEEIFGLKPGQVRDDAAPAFALIHPDDLGPVKEAIAASARTLTPWREEFRVRGTPRGAIWVEGRSVPQPEPEGSILWHGFLHDITERKHLEEQLRQAQKMEAVGQLAGGVAHDFNNIIAAILLHLDLLEDHPTLDARVRESLREIEAGANRAAGLTRQLLLFSRRSVMEVRALDVNEVVENLLKMLRRLIGEHITLDWQGQSGLPPVAADAGMLEQIILNLAVNARDAMPKGGNLLLATETVEVDAAQVPAEAQAAPGRYIRLSVSDTGCGMPAAIIERIFEPFFTTKGVGKGTGLGLATVYGIVQQHQGWVKVESQVGRGSTFHVFLPARVEPVAKPESAPASQPVPRGHETILLVEDDDALRLTVGAYLRRQGYRLLPASNAVVALAVWERHQSEVDLLFTDMVMPEEMSGLELAERLLRERPSLKVIISSGYSEELVKLGGILDPRVICLAKPYDPPQLADTIRRCLDQAQP